MIFNSNNSANQITSTSKNQSHSNQLCLEYVGICWNGFSPFFNLAWHDVSIFFPEFHPFSSKHLEISGGFPLRPPRSPNALHGAPWGAWGSGGGLQVLAPKCDVDFCWSRRKWWYQMVSLSVSDGFCWVCFLWLMRSLLWSDFCLGCLWFCFVVSESKQHNLRDTGKGWPWLNLQI